MVDKPSRLLAHGCRHVYGRRNAWVRSIRSQREAALTLANRLGDRHSENILLDTTSGDLVHVDFNCLFEKVSLSNHNAVV